MLTNYNYDEIFESIGKVLGNILVIAARFVIINYILYVLFCVVVIILLFSINGKLKEILYELKFRRGK